ncbi:MAG: isopentenyl-diphosphate delta-isomerase [Bacteroidetes bacterium]|nr:MAG: isopentenyl-diphosphate delta-isomerase [Bacteroidota bacterium]
MEEKVILVDSTDKEVGTMDKMEAHRNGGTLHRAFSIFIFNSKGEMLLQKRALSKYHSGGLLTNTCCSHPRPREDVSQACKRRLMEEMGMQCELEEIFCFEYKAHLNSGLTEWEYDHVLIGNTDTEPVINPSEVADFIYIGTKQLLSDLDSNPDKYTHWFKASVKKVIEWNNNSLTD